IASDIQGLMMGGWFRFDDATPAANELMVGKRGNGTSMAYHVRRGTGGNVVFEVSGDGTALVIVTATNFGAPGADRWIHVVCRYIASTELKIWINGVANINAASVPASLFDGTADFTIGAANGSTWQMDGRASRVFLFGSAPPDSVAERMWRYQKALYGVT
ncbi:MAG: LamG-like jellyroll fold domain-containing protein, partial [Gammaproteobacteria bacterium]